MRQSSVEILFIFFIGAVLAFIPEFLNNGFYFADDMQHQFMPVFYNIGRTLQAGHFPILSLNTWNGGNYLAEYQFALYNPISLATYIILPYFSSLANAAAFLAIFYSALLSCGIFYLGRVYGLDRYAALLAAIVIVTNNFIAYWLATSWLPGLISITWMSWAWAFLLKNDKSINHWLSSLFFCYLTITSGWPHGTVLIGVLAVGLILQKSYEKNWRHAYLILWSFVTAVLLSMPSLIPLLSMKFLAARPQETMNNELWVANLHDVLNLSFPLQLGIIKGYAGYHLMSVPFLYCAWFMLPLLPLLKWNKKYWSEPTNVTLMVLAALMLVATQGPESLGPLRWPFRFVPYLHILVVIMLLRAISLEGMTHLTSRNVLTSLAIIAFEALFAWQKFPKSNVFVDPGLLAWDMPWTFIEAAVFGICAWGAFLALWKWKKIAGYSVLILVSVFIFLFTRLFFPNNEDYSNWGMSTLRNPNALVDDVPRAYTVYFGKRGEDKDEAKGRFDPSRLAEFQTGDMPLEYGHPTLGGYSPIGHRFFQSRVCMVGIFGETCPYIANRLFEKDAETNVAFADLCRIDHIIALRGPHLQNLIENKSDEWHLEFSGKYTERYQRKLPNSDLPGTLSWISPEVEVAEGSKPETLKETLTVQHTGAHDKLIFARLWWPGYIATFGGADLPVTPYREFLVSVELPEQIKAGTLKLFYRPPHLFLALTAVAIGALLSVLACFAFSLRYFRKNSA